MCLLRPSLNDADRARDTRDPSSLRYDAASGESTERPVRRCDGMCVRALTRVCRFARAREAVAPTSVVETFSLKLQLLSASSSS